MQEVGCKACWSADVDAAWEVIKTVPVHERLIDESHYMVLLRHCQACGQHYLQVTTETVDFYDGEDPIYRTVVPIDEAERQRLLAAAPLRTDVIERIGVDRQALKYDLPKGQEPSVYWVVGVRVGRHD